MRTKSTSVCMSALARTRIGMTKRMVKSWIEEKKMAEKLKKKRDEEEA